jgi:dienelactone hydrolase
MVFNLLVFKVGRQRPYFYMVWVAAAQVLLISLLNLVFQIGFCFGGKYSILLGNKGPNDTPSPVQAFAAGHPSLLKIPGDVENIDPSTPGFLQYAESDFMVSEKNRQDIDQIIQEKSLTNVKTKLYPGTKHGFCLKSNEDDEKERAIATEATTDAAQFFASKL